MVAGNAAISIAESTTNQVIKNQGFENFDISDVLVDGAIGALTGAISGPGRGSKHMTNLGKQTVRRTVNATKHGGFKAGFKESMKAFIYYGKSSASYYKKFAVDIPKDFMNTLGSSAAASDYMKRQYYRAFEYLGR